MNNPEPVTEWPEAPSVPGIASTSTHIQRWTEEADVQKSSPVQPGDTVRFAGGDIVGPNMFFQGWAGPFATCVWFTIDQKLQINNFDVRNLEKAPVRV